MGAKAHLCIVHGKVSNASPQLKESLPLITVAFVLLLCIRDRLLREAVLEFKRGNRQPVYEQPKIQCQRRFIPAISQLPGYAETVLLRSCFRLDVARRWRAIEQIDLVRAMLDSMPQNINHATFADLSLKARKELLSGW